MNYIINNNRYTFEKGYQKKEALRTSLDNLSRATFGGLSFERFYRLGFWTDNLIPYTLFCEGRAVSNLFVSVMAVRHNGKTKRYVQLGTVMTDKEYRNRGLSRFLIEMAIDEWQNHCDALFLFANGSVTDFYPKFGFVKEYEYDYRISVTAQTRKMRRLDMEDADDRDFLMQMVKIGNPFASFAVGSYEYAMFHCTMFYTDCVYYCEDYNAIVVCKEENGYLYCYDIFCDAKNDLKRILSAAATAQNQTIILGFTPADTQGFDVAVSEEADTTLFVLNSKENVFQTERIKFPVLSRT